MAVHILQFIHPWYETQEFATVMAVTCETSGFGEGPMTESVEHFKVDQEAKTSYHGENTSIFAMLEQEVGSCTFSNHTQAVLLRITRLSIE